ncbi:MAG TPA: glycosyltransferase family 9 protein [Anaerolineales bacterium]|nr:glycosyltransferase family 9 protein [Anaerolineales bacterium]
MYAFKKSGKPDPERIVILRALQLGDLLNAVPAFRALRAAFPNSHISLVGLSWSEEFVRRFHTYLDDFIHFPGIPGFPEQSPDLARWPSFLSAMQSRQFDLAIQMQGSGDIANTLVSLWGAKQCAGFYLPGQSCPNPNTFLAYPEHEPEAWRHLRLMEFLGIPLQGDELELPIFDEDWKVFQKIQEQSNLQRNYVCIHPGSRGRERRWPPQNFAVVADRLAARGYQVVLTGTEAEANLTASVALHMRASAIDLAGKTDLGSLAALVSKAQLVVSNDTGISHVAAALKTPSVILFPIPESIRWAPKNEQLHKRIWQAMPMSPDQVLPHVEEHLENTFSYARAESVGSGP